MIEPDRRIRVLVVDDSAFMRRALARMLESAGDIEIAGVAATGEEAVAMQAELRPDIITMDVEMPGMGGLEAARAIIARRGPPIVMVSSLTRDGAETTLRALEIGAVDFIPKPNSASIDIVRVRDDLVEKVRVFGARRRASPPRPPAVSPAAAAAMVAPLPPAAVTVRETLAPAPPSRPAVVPPRSARFECVALGTSTGGPVALSTVLPLIPKEFPLPIVIVQHMPPGFTRPLAERLNNACAIEVVEGESGMRLTRGVAIIAPAGRQLVLRRRGAGVEIELVDDTAKSLHVPSVDIMAAAVGEVYGSAALGVILTGMGHDGVNGLAVIKKNGGYVIGQDEASAVVYGMPRAAAAAGLVDRVVALGDVARALCELTSTPYAPSPDVTRN